MKIERRCLEQSPHIRQTKTTDGTSSGLGQLVNNFKKVPSVQDGDESLSIDPMNTSGNLRKKSLALRLVSIEGQGYVEYSLFHRIGHHIILQSRAPPCSFNN